VDARIETHLFIPLELEMKREKKGYQTLNAYREIKRRIIALEFKPGDSLEENQLGTELGVGRTPIRAALLLLKNEDWIVSLPNKSAYVKEMTLKDVRDLIESLAAVEKTTASLAARRVTEEALNEIRRAEEERAKAVDRRDFWEVNVQNQRFHSLIAKASNNQYLASIHDDLRNKAQRMSYMSVSRGDRHLISVKKDHREIVRCLETRNVRKIEKLSAHHIRLFQSRISTFLQGRQ
jgi:DNA-binding GntR family transcriptional regulator